MWIIAVAWIYVVVLMAATETSLVAGIMTFFGYCVLPLSIVFYITGSKRRRARKAASASAGADSVTHGGIGDSTGPTIHGSGSDGGCGSGDGRGCSGDG